MHIRQSLQRFWHFLWEEDSFASWIANIIVAYVIIKYLVYPGLGLLLGTGYPVVAVVSGSMEHPGGFEQWWQMRCGDETQADLYEALNISEERFHMYPFSTGFNRGDIMVLWNYGQINQGDVIVFRTNRPEPIIHRVVDTNQQFYKTKGDHNCGSAPFERDITQERIIGKAVARIPWLGWVKLGFVRLLNLW